MATASTSWMPAAGRHNVSIGSSLSKALKARKGQPPTQRSKNLPERDFYALRYNHKPASIEPAKPGTLEVNPGKEVTTVRVERPTVNNKEVIVFKGDEKPAKEWECVLIYDEATQTFTLEKLDSLVNLNFDAKAQSRTRPVASPHSASSSSAAQTPRRSPVRTAADELEAQLEDAGTGMNMYPDADADADADGEPDPSFSLAHGKEEEGEEREKAQRTSGVVVAQRRSASSSHHHQKTAAPPPPPAPVTATQAHQQSKPRPTPSSKKSAPATVPQSSASSAKAARASAPAPAQSSSSSKPRPRPVPPAAAVATPPTVVGSAGKRAAAAMENRDVEDFEIRGPIAPVTTSARRSSTAATAPTTTAVAHGSSFSLALPSVSAGLDPLAHQGLYNGGGGGGAPVSSSGAAADSDDEWDEILLDRSQSHQQQQHQGEELTSTMDDEPDDRLVDFLERELLGEDEPMGDADEDEDEEEEMEEEVVVGGHPHPSGPMSMNQFAGGEVAVEDDDDDYSSSEDSEED